MQCIHDFVQQLECCLGETRVNLCFDVGRITEYAHKIGTKSQLRRLIYNTLQSMIDFGTALETSEARGKRK